MKYGLPYKGSKSSIAKWVVDTLPSSETFVDLFAGGCAVTHAAILSGKWKTFIANDISGSTMLFRDAIAGEYENLSTVLTRNEFFASNDLMLKLLYSFGNDSRSYLWGGYYEKAKTPAAKMLSAPSMHERRMYYKEFVKVMCEYIGNVLAEERDDRTAQIQNVEAVQRLERLQGLERLERLQGLERLQVMMADYRNVNLPANATIYADPPYRNTGEHYGGFDFDAFDNWLMTVDHPVYVSEFDAPKGCVCIAERERFEHMSAYTTGKKTERIFVQERFAEEVKNENSIS